MSGDARHRVIGLAGLANAYSVRALGATGPGGAEGHDLFALSHRTHYVFLVFVKVPILLILVGAILWLKGPPGVPKEQWERPVYMHLSSDLTTVTAP